VSRHRDKLFEFRARPVQPALDLDASLGFRIERMA
jgi:hypothetical protein